jgi:hypothetical protein
MIATKTKQTFPTCLNSPPFPQAFFKGVLQWQSRMRNLVR